MCKRYVSWCGNVSVIIVCRTETIAAIEKSTGHICRIYASWFCHVVLFYLIRSVLFSKFFFSYCSVVFIPFRIRAQIVLILILWR